MTEQEKATFEQEIREKIAQERRDTRAEWRKTHKADISRYNRNYYLKQKERRENIHGLEKN